MNIVPAAKGLLSGPCRFRFQPTRTLLETVDPSTDIVEQNDDASCWNYACEEPQLGSVSLPAACCCLISSAWTKTQYTNIQVEWSSPNVPRWLLVVEKEGVFHRLVEDQFPMRLNCVLVSGCGYPDIATRAMVAKMSSLFPMMRVIGMCDYNPHGLALLLSYRFPSTAAAYESSGFQSEIRWLGLRKAHLREFSERANENIIAPTNAMDNQGKTNIKMGQPFDAESNQVQHQKEQQSLVRRQQQNGSFSHSHLLELSPGDMRKIRALLLCLSPDGKWAQLPDDYSEELRTMLLGML